MTEETIEGTAATPQQAGDVALEAQTSESVTPEPAPEAQPERPKTLSEHLKKNFEAKQRDDKGRFASKQNPEPATTPQQPVEQGQKPDELKPLDHWKPEERAAFDSLTPEAKRFVLGQYKSFQSDYTRKTQETADTRKSYERINHAFAPFESELKQMNMDVPTAVERLIQESKATRQFIQSFRQNPRQTVQWLAQQHGVDMAQLMGDTAVTDDDPYLADIRRQVQQPILSKVQQLEQRFHEMQTAPFQAELQRFQTATDEQGNPKYPHFERVRHLMGPLVEQGKTLEEAYNEVTWALPEEREKRLEAERQRLQQEMQQKQQEEVERSRKARQAAGTPLPPGTVDSKGADLSKLPLSQHLKEKARQYGI